MKISSQQTLYQRAAYAVSLLVFAGVAVVGCSSGAKMTTDQQAAMNAAEKARQDSIRNFELLKNWSFGRTNYQNKEYDRVTTYLWKVVEMDENDRFKDVYSLLADTYFKLGKGDSSQIVYEMGVSKFPENVYLQRNLGYIHMQKQEVPKAITRYEEVVKLEPEKVDDWEILADLYVKNQQTAKALEAYQKLATLAPDNPEYQEKMVGLMGDSDEAIEMLHAMVEKNPSDTQTILQLANHYRKERDWVKTATWLEKFTALNPDDVIALEDLALMYKNTSEHDKALGTYDKILAKKPTDAMALTGKSVAYRELGRFRDAMRAARQAIAADNGFGDARVALGKVYEKVVDDCMSKAGRKSPSFDDKLVYEMAYKQYQIATRDVASRDFAEQLVASLDPVIPKKSDRFMNQGQTKPKGACYSWLR